MVQDSSILDGATRAPVGLDLASCYVTNSEVAPETPDDRSGRVQTMLPRSPSKCGRLAYPPRRSRRRWIPTCPIIRV
jgi:hypothetical protein